MKCHAFIFLNLLSLGSSIMLDKSGPPIESEELEAGDFVDETYDSMDYAALVDPLDELMIGDTALVLDHIDIDIREFEELKERIHYLESTMSRHANTHVVDFGEIKDANLLLQDIDLKVMKPFEDHLVALKAQIMKPHVKYDNETYMQISTLIKTSELFLQAAEERVEDVEEMEQEWEAAEESAAIQEMDANQKRVYKKRKQEQWSAELVGKLEVQGGEGAPVGRPAGGAVVTMEGAEGSLQRRKNLAKEKDEQYYRNLPKNGDRNVDEEVERDYEADLYEQKINTRVGLTAEDENEPKIPVDAYKPAATEAMDKAADASHQFIQQKLMEHIKVLEAAGDLPSRLPFLALLVIVIGLAILFMGLFVLYQRSTQTSRKLHFQAVAPDAGSPGGEQRRQQASYVEPRSSGYCELSETKERREAKQREAESTPAPGVWPAGLVTPFRSTTTPLVRNEYKMK